MTGDFDDFFRRFLSRGVRYLCRRYFLDANDAEDLAQEVLIAAYQEGIHRQEREPWPWLMRVLNNKAVDLLRQHWRRKTHLIPDSDELLEHTESADSSGQFTWIEYLAQSGYELTGQRQEILSAGRESIREVGEFSVPFVACHLGIKENALYVALSRFRNWVSDESGLSWYTSELQQELPLLKCTSSLSMMTTPSLNAGSVWSLLHWTFWENIYMQHEAIIQTYIQGAEEDDVASVLRMCQEETGTWRFHLHMAVAATFCEENRRNPSLNILKQVKYERESRSKPENRRAIIQKVRDYFLSMKSPQAHLGGPEPKLR